MYRILKISALGLGACLAFVSAVGLPAQAKARISYSRNHQFQYAQLPTSVRGQYRIGLWAFNPTNGQVRLCVLGAKSEANRIMNCSGWVGEGPPGAYRLMQIRINRNNITNIRAGLWILNYKTGDARACVITDIDDPTGSLKCSKSR